MTAVPPIVVIAASAGGVEALSTVLRPLWADFPAAIVIVQHRSPYRASVLNLVLGRKTRLPVVDAVEGSLVRAGTVYLAKPDRHLLISKEGEFLYVDGPRIRHLFSSANPLFASVADACGSNVIAVVLTGSGMDAADGVQAVKRHGGVVIAQDPQSSAFAQMPQAAIETGTVDYVLPLESIAPTLQNLLRKRAA